MKNIIKTIKNIININNVLTRLEKVEGEILPKKEESSRVSFHNLFTSLWDFSSSSTLLERVDLLETKLKTLENFLKIEIVEEKKESKYVAKKIKKSK